MDNERAYKAKNIERFGPKQLSYNEILEMELSKVKEYIGQLDQKERSKVFSTVRN